MIHKKRLVETFLELVQVDSPSGSEDEVDKFLSQKLESLGAQVFNDPFGNVIGKFKGAGAPFMLNAHMDTVEPGRGIKPIIDGDIIKTDGTTVLGGDPKAGVSAILEALSSLKEQKKELALEVVFTRSEEVGLLGAVNLDYSIISAHQGLTFDGEARITNVDIAAPGLNTINAIITGRAAHAGVEPEKGISSIQIASQIITNLTLGRIDYETTTNIGLIEGGSARNAVPETTIIKGEIRSRDLGKLEAQTKKFKDIFEKIMTRHPEATLDLDINRDFEPYNIDPNHTVLQKINKVFDAMGLKANALESGGGTDVNIFHSHGIEAIVVGTGDYEAHTKREFVKISEMLEASVFCERFLLS